MKAILYVVAIVAIAAAGWFSYSTKTLLEEKKEARETLEKENANLEASIKTKGKEADEMEKAYTEAKTKRVQAEEDRDSTKSLLKVAKGQVAAWQSKIDGQNEKIGEFAKTKKEIQEKFKDELDGRNVTMEEIPGLIKNLEEDLKKKNRKLEELQQLTEAAGKRVKSKNKQIAELTDRMAKRAERIRANSLQGTVTAVNHDWGFAVVSVPKKMPVDDASQLIVKRGTTFVGRLKINAIENGRVMTDVDYKSMTPGMVVQPGDSVVLAKPVTQ